MSNICLDHFCVCFIVYQFYVDGCIILCVLFLFFEH